MLPSHPCLAACRSREDRRLQCGWFPPWLLQRSSHWYVQVKFQLAAKSSEHVGVRRVASKEFWTHNTSAESLRWLPVQYRVTFKTATLVYFIKDTGQPAYYLGHILQDYVPVRTLKSSSRNLIFKSTVGTALASRGFRHSAAAVWNDLPDDIRYVKYINIYKRKLKN